ncbi:uncharacterized protein LOC141583344 [Saimiri boliviensis]|uniref:uncharacterized protein LOC141583344 n=1 Tax=Saimiri boliviensis TaxID=27679 RepID=UPI003D77B8C3
MRGKGLLGTGVSYKFADCQQPVLVPTSAESAQTDLSPPCPRSQEQHICLESAVTFPSPHLSVSQELMEYTVQPRSVLGRKRSKQQGAILAIKGWQVKATWKFSLARKMGNVSNCCLRACCIEEQGMDPGFTGKSTVCCHSPKKRILRHWPPIRLRRRVASMEACSIHDGRVDPGISEESTVCHCKPKKGIFCRWLPWCMRPRVAPMEDHNKQEPSSEATPGIHMVDTATQTSRTALQQEDTSVNAAEGQEAAGLQQAGPALQQEDTSGDAAEDQV